MIEGLVSLLNAIESRASRMERAALDAADEIATMLESYAKTNAPFTDHSTNLRNSIRGEVEPMAVDLVAAVLSAGMEYAPFVEKLHEERYAYLRPAVEANREEMLQIVRKHFGGGA